MGGGRCGGKEREKVLKKERKRGGKGEGGNGIGKKEGSF